MKYLLFSLLLLGTQLYAWSREVTGTVKSEAQALANVVVSDGTHFAVTNSSGKFTLEVSDNSDFVYLFTPSGYTAPFSSGVPQFYQSLKSDKNSYEFNLQKLPFGGERFALLATADPQTKTIEHFNRFEEQSIPDLNGTIADFQKKKVNAIGIALGDIAWDELSLFQNYKEAVAGLNIPFYPVIGNHDHDKDINDDYGSEAVYRQNFGPTYYGFNLGKQHYIVLDNIVYKGEKKYDEDLTGKQIEWVKNYLKLVPAGEELIFAMHAPFKNLRANKMIPHGQQLLDLCKDYKVSFMSGHTHLNSNAEVAPGIIEHNVGALCGTWWTAEVCRDGTPNGYQVFEIAPDNYSWYYKSVGKAKDYQVEVFQPGQVANNPNAVVAKVWNWDPTWKVEWFEDGQLKGEMKRFSSYDPDYLRYLQQNTNGGIENVPGYKQPVKTFFYFSATPSSTAKTVHIVVSDPFGNQYKKQIELKSVDVAAHRGGAGLMPENTIPAMLNAVKLGVNTLELDLHISNDGKVIVVHDANFNPLHTLSPQGTSLTDATAEELYFYQLPYDEIQQYDVGTKVYSRFPDQQKIRTHIPLLSDLIDSVENFTATNGYGSMVYNIEIKSDAKLENQGLVPAFNEFVDKAMQVLQAKNLGERLILQSFDTRTLNYLHKQYPQIRISYLVGNKKTVSENMQSLDFVPEIFSPNYQMVNQKLIKDCKKLEMKVIPWTVDDTATIDEMMKFEVDGIISNYPNRVLKTTRGY